MKYVLLVLVSFALYGCDSVKVSKAEPTQDSVLGGKIEIVNLDDGTRCAVWSGFRSGGISCDWKN